MKEPAPDPFAKAADLLTEALRMYQNYAFIATPHPNFHQGRWNADVRDVLKQLGRPIPEPSADEQVAARAVLKEKKEVISRWLAKL